VARLTFRFHGDLNGFLAPSRREEPFAHTVPDRTALKDVIEALGVPHTEVGRLTSDGAPATLEQRVADGAHIEVWPVPPESAAREGSLQPEPPHPLRFVLDVHLGRLAAYLRMLGVDTIYERHNDDDVLARISSQEQRILLTRDVGLLKRAEVRFGHYMRATDPERQLTEVMRRYALAEALSPFSRCARCNGSLRAVPKTEVADALPPLVRARYEEFRRCESCGQLYWPGSHYQRVLRMVHMAAGTGLPAPETAP
jgi:uncharacterized protein with PIN domain